MNHFLEFAKKNSPVIYEKLSSAGGATAAKAGSDKFTGAWKDLAKQDPAFSKLQHDFIGATHYQPQADRLKTKLGIDLDQHSQALREAVWSMAVQHNNGTQTIFQKALAGRNVTQLSDRDIIQAVYAERRKVDIYFKRSTPAVKESVRKRFVQEEKDLLQLLGK